MRFMERIRSSYALVFLRLGLPTHWSSFRFRGFGFGVKTAHYTESH